MRAVCVESNSKCKINHIKNLFLGESNSSFSLGLRFGEWLWLWAWAMAAVGWWNNDHCCAVMEY